MYCILIFPVILSSCASQQIDIQAHAESVAETCLIHLIESTNIIRTLMAQNKLGELLEEHEPEQIALLLNNTSPAQMAFETEVLSTVVPLVVVYYFQVNEESRNYIKELEKLAVQYDNQVKFVVVDAEKLFSLVQIAEIEKLPYIELFKDKGIIDSYKEGISSKSLEQKLVNYLR